VGRIGDVDGICLLGAFEHARMHVRTGKRHWFVISASRQLSEQRAQRTVLSCLRLVLCLFWFECLLAGSGVVTELFQTALVLVEAAQSAPLFGGFDSRAIESGSCEPGDGVMLAMSTRVDQDSAILDLSVPIRARRSFSSHAALSK